jgi:hypothetical protein
MSRNAQQVDERSLVTQVKRIFGTRNPTQYTTWRNAVNEFVDVSESLDCFEQPSLDDERDFLEHSLRLFSKKLDKGRTGSNDVIDIQLRSSLDLWGLATGPPPSSMAHRDLLAFVSVVMSIGQLPFGIQTPQVWFPGTVDSVREPNTLVGGIPPNFVLVGANGAGKSFLVRALSKLNQGGDCGIIRRPN